MAPYRGATLDAAAALRERAREKELAKAKYKEARERDKDGKEAKEAIREAKVGCLSIAYPLPSLHTPSIPLLRLCSVRAQLPALLTR